MESKEKLGISIDEARKMLGIGRNLMLEFEIITPVNYSYVDATPNIEQPVYQNNVFQKQTSETENQNKIKFFEQNQIAPVKSKSFETVALEWFEYKKSLTEKPAKK